MIKFENTEVEGWKAAVRGMRNPMNSWDKSDSTYCSEYNCDRCGKYAEYFELCSDVKFGDYVIGPNDYNLMLRLSQAGTDHSKFLRMINVTVDITAPMYWWKEFDTYKVGTVRNSCSTMHKIHAKEFTLDDFSCEHLKQFEWKTETDETITHKAYNFALPLENLILTLNIARSRYLETKDKDYWWQMIQLLPSSYNQKATVQLNYQVLRNIYHSERKKHKLDEWRIGFMEWIESLPYSELITGTVSKKETVAENETTTDDDHSCATCEWYTDGRCLKDCENHEWYDYCLNHKPKAATTNDHFRDATKKIDLVEE